MKILCAGVTPEWRIPPGWQMFFRPLDRAETLTEYDLVILKPSFFGGLFDPSFQSQYTENGNGFKIWAHKATAGAYIDKRLYELARDLYLLGFLGRLVVLPVDSWPLAWDEPKNVEATVAQLNRTLGRQADNFNHHWFTNLDPLSTWDIEVENPRQGASVDVTLPGHPLTGYLSLPGMRWEATYRPQISHDVIAADSTGHYSVAFEVNRRGSRLIVVPETTHREGLVALVEGMQQLATTRQSTRIRLSNERYALDQMDQAKGKLAAAEGELSGASREFVRTFQETDSFIAGNPVLSAALADYNEGLNHGRPEGLTSFTRAWERLTRDAGGEHKFMQVTGLTNAQKKALKQVANQETRHAPTDNPARPAIVSSEEFEAARVVIQEAIEKYGDILAESSRAT